MTNLPFWLAGEGSSSLLNPEENIIARDSDEETVGREKQGCVVLVYRDQADELEGPAKQLLLYILRNSMHIAGDYSHWSTILKSLWNSWS